jgi:hypothetical protein
MPMSVQVMIKVDGSIVRQFRPFLFWNLFPERFNSFPYWTCVLVELANLSAGNRNDLLDPFHLSVRLKHRLYVHSGETFQMIMQRVDEQLFVLFFELSNYL